MHLFILGTEEVEEDEGDIDRGCSSFLSLFNGISALGVISCQSYPFSKIIVLLLNSELVILGVHVFPRGISPIKDIKARTTKVRTWLLQYLIPAR